MVMRYCCDYSGCDIVGWNCNCICDIKCVADGDAFYVYWHIFWYLQLVACKIAQTMHFLSSEFVFTCKGNPSMHYEYYSLEILCGS